MRNFDAFDLNKNREIPKEKKEIELENIENLSPESIPYRNMKMDSKITDLDGITDFAESSNGDFIAYTTSKRDVIKVFDQKTGMVKILHTTNKKLSEYVLPEGINFSDYGNRVAIGYMKGKNYSKQWLSRDDDSGKMLLSGEVTSEFNRNYLLNKGKKNVVDSCYSDEVDFTDLSSGERKKVHLDFYSSEIIDSETGSKCIAVGDGEIVILDKDKKEVLEKIKIDSSIMSVSLLDGDNSFVLSHDKNLDFYENRNDKFEKIKELNIGFRVDQITEAADKKHLICHSYNYGNYFVIEKDTGRIVNKIAAEYLRQNKKGEISILNKDEAIEKYIPIPREYQCPPGDKYRVEKVFIAGEEASFGKDEYSTFDEVKNETVEGLFWNNYENVRAKQVKLEWGKQRIYLEIPLHQLEHLKSLSMDIASEINIPISFKLLDLQKTDLNVAKDTTRFVLNFKNVNDARSFYDFLSKEKTYKEINPDRKIDYYAHQLDNKANYAFGSNEYAGFREYRKDDLEKLEKWKNNNFTKNEDGTYNVLNVETGKSQILSVEEYQDIINGRDPVFISKQNWEKGG